MNIVNEANVDASWFCYNSDDAAQTFALASGDLSANGGKFSYDPPKNATGWYHVKFTVKGVPPLEHLIPKTGVGPDVKVPPTPSVTYGAGEVTAAGTIVLKGSDRPYQVQNAGTGHQAG